MIVRGFGGLCEFPVLFGAFWTHTSPGGIVPFDHSPEMGGGGLGESVPPFKEVNNIFRQVFLIVQHRCGLGCPEGSSSRTCTPHAH